jgi:hypothetical protein
MAWIGPRVAAVGAGVSQFDLSHKPALAFCIVRKQGAGDAAQRMLRSRVLDPMALEALGVVRVAVPHL